MADLPTGAACGNCRRLAVCRHGLTGSHAIVTIDLRLRKPWHLHEIRYVSPQHSRLRLRHLRGCGGRSLCQVSGLAAKRRMSVTPAAIVRRNGLLLVVSIGATFVVLRAMLHMSPNSDFDVAGYNIHHLFTGILFIIAGGIPLAMFRGSSRRMDVAVVVFGVGLGMSLDEWIYLIATDGTNASYLLPVSFWGGLAVVGIACGYAMVLVAARSRRSPNRDGA